jgi:hypothetical protein
MPAWQQYRKPMMLCQAPTIQHHAVSECESFVMKASRRSETLLLRNHCCYADMPAWQQYVTKPGITHLPGVQQHSTTPG